jgi:hypothetical protein
LDRDYLDDAKFPPDCSGGVLVLTAPEQKGFMVLLMRLDREVFCRGPVPLEGRKLHLHVDWKGLTD